MEGILLSSELIARMRRVLDRLEPQETDPQAAGDLVTEIGHLTPARQRANAALLGNE